MACESYYRSLTRRDFFGQSARGLGVAALASLLGDSLRGDTTSALAIQKLLPHFAPKAKRVIYLFMLGAPSQIDLLDYKPGLDKLFDTDLPESVRKGQRLTGMTSGQARFPVAPSKFKFTQHGQAGTWFSEILPWTAKMADDLCVIKTMHTEAINHEPANSFINTGNMNPGKPCIGSWLSYGLGSMNENLPTFVVLHAQHSNPASNVQAISARLWSSGPIPSATQRRRHPPDRCRHPVPRRPARHGPRHPPPDVRQPRRPQPAGGRRVPRPGNPHPHRPV